MDAERRAAWLEDRRTMIGSSDAAAVLGLSRYRSALHVYISKVKPAEDDPRSGNPCEWEPKDFGNYFEEDVARLYQLATGRAVMPPPEPILRMPGFPYVGCSLDRVAFAPDEPTRVVECKTSGDPEEWGKEGTDDVAEEIVIQAQHQLLVTGFTQVDVPVLIGGNDFRIYAIKRSDELHERMLKKYAEFWEQVQTLRPPEFDWRHPATPRLVKQLYDGVIDVTRDLDGESLIVADAYRSARQERLRLQKTEEALQAKLLEKMGSAAHARLPDGTRMRRTVVERDAYAVAPGRHVKFTISGPKE